MAETTREAGRDAEDYDARIPLPVLARRVRPSARGPLAIARA
jgi:hypothetical protein